MVLQVAECGVQRTVYGQIPQVELHSPRNHSVIDIISKTAQGVERSISHRLPKPIKYDIGLCSLGVFLHLCGDILRQRIDDKVRSELLGDCLFLVRIHRANDRGTFTLYPLC